ncbi:NAD(P)-dependent oxidoreductase [Streptomyces wuyuanensis]|uniref:NAD(P)-dependent oxidoreductase n=1 Tax=Streptomyces wuyuanensis TaxID=1196353 RepID=UPI0037150918
MRATAGTTVGILHPGSMGAAVASQLRRAGTQVVWDATGRSPATVRRAREAGLTAACGMAELLALSDVVISLCPPAAAEDVALQVAEHSPAGKIYVEANAVSPERVRRIADALPQAVVIDAAVIGSPPVGGKQPRLYVSGAGEALDHMDRLFATTDVRVRPLGGEIGRASALKLAYTSYQKASRVLAAVAYGVAEANGVAEELLDIAERRSGSYLAEPGYIPKTAARAWRWAPEMEEAAELVAEAGLPDDLMRAAAAVLSRWEGARDADLSIEEALGRLRDGSAGTVSPPD